jgi:hypothetical protein
MTDGPARTTSDGGGGDAPKQAGLVLIALILVAAVANLNLAVANVALPDIGKEFDSSQVTLNLIAVGYSLGLAASVLYLGALGDRYGRKLMLVLGTLLAVPMSPLRTQQGGQIGPRQQLIDHRGRDVGLARAEEVLHDADA